MDPSKYPNCTLADELFPHECIVLYKSDYFDDGQVFLYWDMAGRKQHVTTNEIAADLQARSEE